VPSKRRQRGWPKANHGPVQNRTGRRQAGECTGRKSAARHSLSDQESRAVLLYVAASTTLWEHLDGDPQGLPFHVSLMGRNRHGKETTFASRCVNGSPRGAKSARIVYEGNRTFVFSVAGEQRFAHGHPATCRMGGKIFWRSFPRRESAYRALGDATPTRPGAWPEQLNENCSLLKRMPSGSGGGDLFWPGSRSSLADPQTRRFGCRASAHFDDPREGPSSRHIRPRDRECVGSCGSTRISASTVPCWGRARKLICRSRARGSPASSGAPTKGRFVVAGPIAGPSQTISATSATDLFGLEKIAP